MTQPLYPIDAIRAQEQMIYEHTEMSAYKLMCLAGERAFKRMKENWPLVKSIGIFIGKGNNGGDGLVLARLAQLDGISVTVYYTHNLNEISETANKALCDMSEPLSKMIPFKVDAIEKHDLLVDALLGIGAVGEVQSPIKDAITYINSVHVPIYAIDVPSGLNANTGEVANIAVCADKTVTFIGLKPGLFMLDGRDVSGEVILESLDGASPISAIQLLDNCEDPRKPRLHNSHKGHYGSVLIVGGNHNMGGAALLSAMASLNMGAGSVRICCDPKFHSAIVSRQPELMVYEPSDLDELINSCHVIALGPGLGTDKSSESIYKTVIKADKPMVVDASALRILAKQPQRRDNWILTPHPGEAAALLSSTATDIQKNRWDSTVKLVDTFGGTVVLKGSGTVIANNEVAFICPYGNPHMAQAGMGDVLTGIIAALLAQGVKPIDAARYGVYVHARAGDRLLLSKQNVLASTVATNLINA